MQLGLRQLPFPHHTGLQSPERGRPAGDCNRCHRPRMALLVYLLLMAGAQAGAVLGAGPTSKWAGQQLPSEARQNRERT